VSVYALTSSCLTRLILGRDLSAYEFSGQIALRDQRMFLAGAQRGFRPARMKGPCIQGLPGGRFIYLNWVTVGDADTVRLFRRARLWLDGVPPAVSAAVGSWPGCRFAAPPAPSAAALVFLGRMHHADCAHVAGGAEPHDGKARNWRLEGDADRAAPAHRPDLEAAGNDDGDFAHAGVDDNLDVPVIELGLAQINRYRAHACVDLGETAHLPAALEANLAHRGRDLERLLTPSRGRGEFDGGRQAANHRGEVSLGTDPEQCIEGCLKAVEIHLAAGQESLQEVDPALLEVLRDRGLGLGWEPVVHVRRLPPDARTDIRAGPAPRQGSRRHRVAERADGLSR
jgi:Family of unknown function (DUF5990)